MKNNTKKNEMTTIETLMDSLKNCRKAISQTIPFSRQDDLLKKIEADIMAEIRTAMNNTPRKKTR
jgi:hypothetical protein